MTHMALMHWFSFLEYLYRWVTVESFLHLCQHVFHKGHCSSLAFDIGHDPNTFPSPHVHGACEQTKPTRLEGLNQYFWCPKSLDTIDFSRFWVSFINFINHFWASNFGVTSPIWVPFQETVFPRSGRCDFPMRDGGSCDEACAPREGFSQELLPPLEN